jgi:hypothetical protein
LSNYFKCLGNICLSVDADKQGWLHKDISEASRGFGYNITHFANSFIQGQSLLPPFHLS